MRDRCQDSRRRAGLSAVLSCRHAASYAPRCLCAAPRGYLRPHTRQNVMRLLLPGAPRDPTGGENPRAFRAMGGRPHECTIMCHCGGAEQEMPRVVVIGFARDGSTQASRLHHVYTCEKVADTPAHSEPERGPKASIHCPCILHLLYAVAVLTIAGPLPHKMSDRL